MPFAHVAAVGDAETMGRVLSGFSGFGGTGGAGVGAAGGERSDRSGGNSGGGGSFKAPGTKSISRTPSTNKLERWALHIGQKLERDRMAEVRSEEQQAVLDGGSARCSALALSLIHI